MGRVGTLAAFGISSVLAVLWAVVLAFPCGWAWGSDFQQMYSIGLYMVERDKHLLGEAVGWLAKKNQKADWVVDVMHGEGRAFLWEQAAQSCGGAEGFFANLKTGTIDIAGAACESYKRLWVISFIMLGCGLFVVGFLALGGVLAWFHRTSPERRQAESDAADAGTGAKFLLSSAPFFAFLGVLQYFALLPRGFMPTEHVGTAFCLACTLSVLSAVPYLLAFQFDTDSGPEYEALKYGGRAGGEGEYGGAGPPQAYGDGPAVNVMVVVPGGLPPAAQPPPAAPLGYAEGPGAAGFGPPPGYGAMPSMPADAYEPGAPVAYSTGPAGAYGGP